MKYRVLIEKVTNVFLNILIALFGVLLLISLYSFLQVKIFKNEYANFFGYSIFEIQTNSMAPTIHANDWVMVKIGKDVKLNDVITFKLNNKFITHRITEQYKGTYITKGDANTGKDKPVDEKQIVGKVTKILDNFGIFRKTLFDKTVLLVLIITMFGVNLIFKNKNKKNDVQVVIEKVSEPVTESVEVTNTAINKESLEEPVVAQTMVEKLFNVQGSNENIETLSDEEVMIQPTLVNGTTIIVSANEIDNTRLEIEQNKKAQSIAETVSMIKNRVHEDEVPAEPVIEDDVPIVQEETPVETEEPITDIELPQIEEKQNQNKFDNIIDKVISIKMEELNEIIKVFVSEPELTDYDQIIKQKFMVAYINASYYNNFGGNDIKDADNLSKIEYLLNNIARDLSQHSTNELYNDKVSLYHDIFLFITNVECTNHNDIKQMGASSFYKSKIEDFAIDKSYTDEQLNYLVARVVKVIKSYVNILVEFVEKLESELFVLNISRLDTKLNIYGASLKHNIHFDKLYSDYIIKETYSKGIIAETKMEVLLNLLSIQLIANMMLFEFNDDYIVNIPPSLYSKKSKLLKLIKLIDNKFAKEHVYFLINFSVLVAYRKLILNIRKQGYKFGVLIDDNVVISNSNRKYLYMADYIFVGDENIDHDDITRMVPDDLLNSVIYENALDKVDELQEGGE